MELKATALTKRFKRLVLFRELSLTIRPGMSVAVVGPNGSGKSTLLQIMAGLQWPTKGTVRFSVEGRAVAREEQLLQIGFVAPYINLYADFTARENLSFLAKARRLPDAASRINALLDRVGLAGRGDDLLRTFSSGMVQRMRLAAGLLHRPPLLFLDEPVTNLDDPGRRLVRTVVAEQTAAGGGVVLATNAAAPASWCADRLSVTDYT